MIRRQKLIVAGEFFVGGSQFGVGTRNRSWIFRPDGLIIRRACDSDLVIVVPLRLRRRRRRTTQNASGKD